MAAVSGTFTGTGVSVAFTPTPQLGRDNETIFNVSLAGVADATVQLQRSFDGGVVWKVVKEYVDTSAEELGTEPETGVTYRFECTVYGSGTVTYRLSTN